MRHKPFCYFFGLSHISAKHLLGDTFMTAVGRHGSRHGRWCAE